MSGKSALAAHSQAEMASGRQLSHSNAAVRLDDCLAARLDDCLTVRLDTCLDARLDAEQALPHMEIVSGQHSSNTPAGHAVAGRDTP